MSSQSTIGADARAVLRAAEAGTLFPDVERRLALYLRAVWGRPIELRANRARSELPEGTQAKRASIADGRILMPHAVHIVPGQDGVTLYRATAAHAAAHLVYSSQRFPFGQLRPIQVALVSLIEDARVEHLAMRELPGLERLWRPFHVALPDSGVTAVSLMARLGRALFDPAYDDDDGWIAKGRALFAEHTGHLDDPSLSRAIGMLLGHDLGQMRVPFNWKTYLVEPRYRDDNQFLWDSGDAGEPHADDTAVWQAVDLQPEEPGERELNAAAAGARPGAEATSTGEWSAADEAPPQPYQYDEWDYAIGLSRPAWCTVLDRRGRFGDADRISDVLARNQDTLTRLARLVKLAQVDRPRRRRQQIEGEQLDLDACVAATVDLRAGRAPQPHVYQRAGRGGRDLAALLLLDLSESTNQYVPSAGATVLTLAVEATTLVGHAMATIGDTFAIHGFSSAGRSAVEYHRFKDFDEPYDDHVHARLAAIQGRLSTRMGAAVRHAGHFLRFRRVARKLILVVTDGRPHDIDVHDHQYLVFDAKRAVDEQARTGIATFCISLDAGADDYVGRIFGARNYVVLDRLHRLPEIVPRLYFRLRQ